jgi:hypothetical protein
MLHIRNIHLAYLIILLYACKSVKPLSGAIQNQPLPEQPSSQIHIPVTVDLKQYIKEAEQKVPLTFNGKEDPCEGIRYAYTFNRSPLQFNGKADKIYLSLKGVYQLSVSFCPACAFGNCIIPRLSGSCGVGESARRLEIGYETKLRIKPNYELESNSTLIKLDAIDKCNITFLQFDITDRIMEIVKSSTSQLVRDFDQEIGKKDFKTDFSKMWDTLSSPVMLDDGIGYFYFKPQSLSLSPFLFEGNLLKCNAALIVKPIVLSQNKNTDKHKNLPPLISYQPSKGFNVYTDLNLDYDSLTKRLNKKLSGEKISFHRRDFTIENVEVSAAKDGKILLIVDFGGYKKGKMHIAGNLVLDTLSSKVKLVNVKLSVKSKSLPLKTAVILYKKSAVRNITDQAVFSYKGYAEDAKKKIEQNINQTIQGKYIFSGKASRLSVDALYVSDKGVVVRTITSGDINLYIK